LFKNFFVECSALKEHRRPAGSLSDHDGVARRELLSYAPQYPFPQIEDFSTDYLACQNFFLIRQNFDKFFDR
jgi:hypothetical protein